jgi:hypothetical protein
MGEIALLTLFFCIAVACLCIFAGAVCDRLRSLETKLEELAKKETEVEEEDPADYWKHC